MIWIPQQACLHDVVSQADNFGRQRNPTETTLVMSVGDPAP